MNMGQLDLVFNIGNLLFHKTNNRWNLNVFAGAGLGVFKTRVNGFILVIV